MRFAKQSKGKKNIAVLLVVAMLLTIMPVAAFAVDGESGAGTEATAAMYDGEGNKVTTLFQSAESQSLEARLTTGSAYATTVYVTWSTDSTEREVAYQEGIGYSDNQSIAGGTNGTVTATFSTEKGELAIAKATIVKADTVAMIGENQYASLDEAIAKAADGDTIEVLSDCETKTGIGLGATKLTINGNNHKIDFLTKGIYLARDNNTKKKAELIFNDCKINMAPSKGTPAVWGDVYGWAEIVLNWDCEISFNHSEMEMSPVVASAIYYHLGSKFNMVNSKVMISGFSGSGFQTDDQQESGNYITEINMDKSTLDITKCYAGITSTIQVAVKNHSTLNNYNNRGNGSNGADYIIDSSIVNISGNGSHGMSARNITAKDATITTNGNGMNGIIFTGEGNFNSSNVTIIGTKGTSYWNAGMRLKGKIANGFVDKDSTIAITDNLVSGIFLDSGAQFKVEEDADVLITRNYAEQKNCSTKQEIARCGGGILVREGAKATLSNSTKIYNNHASIAGDDIYNLGNIAFSVTGSDWALDGAPDCNGKIHAIDGWYDDSEGTRWEAHATADNGKTNHVVQFTDFDETGRTTLVGTKALKAAHGLLSASQLTCNYYVKDKNGNVKLEGAVEYDSEIGKVETTVTKNPSEYTIYNGKTYVYDETNPSNKNSVVLEKSLEELNNVPYPLTLNYIREEKDDTPTGGGGTITPNPDPEPPTTDPEKPPVEITDPDVPLVEPEDPTTEIDEPDVPLVEPGTPVEEIDEPEVPLGDAPKTGDAAPIVGLVGLLIVAVAGLVVVRRKFN